MNRNRTTGAMWTPQDFYNPACGLITYKLTNKPTESLASGAPDSSGPWWACSVIHGCHDVLAVSFRSLSGAFFGVFLSSVSQNRNVSFHSEIPARSFCDLASFSKHLEVVKIIMFTCSLLLETFQQLAQAEHTE